MGQGPLGQGYFFNAKTGSSTGSKGGAQGDGFVSQRHGSLYSAAYAGTLMTGSNQSGATTSAALATTYTGLCLSNPAGSGVNLSVMRVMAALNVAPAAEVSFGLILGYAAAGIVTHTTALAPVNAFLNGAAPVGKLDAACTLVGTPFWGPWLGSTPGATSPVSFNISMDGSLIIPPGGYVAIGSTAAGPAAGLLGTLFWEELAL